MKIIKFAFIFTNAMTFLSSSLLGLESSEALVKNLVQQEAQKVELVEKLQKAQKAREQNERERNEQLKKLEEISIEYGDKSKEFLEAEKNYNQADGKAVQSDQVAKKLETDLQDTMKQLNEINKSLATLVERGKNVTERQQISYQIDLEKKLVELSKDDAQQVLQNALQEIKDNIFYDEQKDELAALIIVARRNGAADVVQAAQERIRQIEQFQKNPPPSPRNELEKRLNLKEKIEDDRLQTIVETLVDAMSELQEVVDVEEQSDISSVRNSMQKLDMLKGALAHYVSDDNLEQKNYLISLIDDLKARPKAIIQEATAEYKKQLDRNRKLLQMALDAKGPSMEETVQFVEQGVDTVWQGLKSLGNWVLQTTDFYATVKRMAKNEKAQEEKIREWGNRAEQAPQVAQEAIRVIGEVEQRVKQARSWIQWIGDDLVKKVAPKLYAKFEKVEKNIIPKAQQKAPTVKSIVDVVAGRVAAPFLLKAADLSEWFGQTLEQIGRQSPQDRQKQAKAKMAIEKARALIEMERNRLPGQVAEKQVAQVPGASEPKTTYAALFQNLKAFFKGLAQDLIAFFKRKEPELTELQNRYEKNRVAYLAALGFTQEAIQDGIAAQEVQDKLYAIAFDKAELARVTPYHDAFVRSMRDLASVAQEITDRMVATKANVDFLINAWDQVQVNQAPTAADLEKAPEYAIAGMTNAIIQARDMRYAYLDAARNGVALLQEDLQQMAPYQTGIIAQQMGQELANMLTGALAEAIVDSVTVSRAMDKQLANAQAVIDKQISTAQPPPQEN